MRRGKTRTLDGMSRRTVYWLAFAASGAVAYPLVFWEAFWPLGRYIAGWYVIFVACVLFAVLGVTLSVRFGRLDTPQGFLARFLYFF